MYYSLELLENNKGLFVQTTKERIKHGAKGKVILGSCLKHVADSIVKENSF